MVSLYDVGTTCWYPDEKLGWIGAKVVSNKSEGNKHVIKLVSEQDESQEFTVETDNLSEDNEKLPPLRNPLFWKQRKI